MSERSRFSTNLLLHPVVLTALLVWLANDHWGKASYPGWLSGKLSDVASLIVFPLIPIAALAMWRRRTPSRGWLAGSLLATGGVMAAINTSAAAASVYRYGLAVVQWPFRALGAGALVDLRPVQLTMDPGDLLTLPALLVPLLLLRSEKSRRARR
jgi:hypothetical protein